MPPVTRSQARQQFNLASAAPVTSNKRKRFPVSHDTQDGSSSYPSSLLTAGGDDASFSFPLPTTVAVAAVANASSKSSSAKQPKGTTVTEHTSSILSLWREIYRVGLRREGILLGGGGHVIGGGVVNCPCRNNLISPSAVMLVCSVCHCWVHPVCCGLSSDPYIMAAVQRANSYVCPWCTGQALTEAIPALERSSAVADLVNERRDIMIALGTSSASSGNATNKGNNSSISSAQAEALMTRRQETENRLIDVAMDVVNNENRDVAENRRTLFASTGSPTAPEGTGADQDGQEKTKKKKDFSSAVFSVAGLKEVPDRLPKLKREEKHIRDLMTAVCGVARARGYEIIELIPPPPTTAPNSSASTGGSKSGGLPPSSAADDSGAGSAVRKVHLTDAVREECLQCCQSAIDDMTFSNTYPRYCLDEQQRPPHSYLQAAAIIPMASSSSSSRSSSSSSSHTGGGSTKQKKEKGRAGSNNEAVAVEEIAAFCLSTGMDTHGSLLGMLRTLRDADAAQQALMQQQELLQQQRQQFNALINKNVKKPAAKSSKGNSSATADKQQQHDEVSAAGAIIPFAPEMRKLTQSSTETISDFVHFSLLSTKDTYRGLGLGKLVMCYEMLRWALRGRHRAFVSMALQKVLPTAVVPAAGTGSSSSSGSSSLPPRSGGKNANKKLIQTNNSKQSAGVAATQSSTSVTPHYLHRIRCQIFVPAFRLYTALGFVECWPQYDADGNLVWSKGEEDDGRLMVSLDFPEAVRGIVSRLTATDSSTTPSVTGKRSRSPSSTTVTQSTSKKKK